MATDPKKSVRASATASAKATAKPTGEKPQGLKVIPKRAGFRRAGYSFPDGETTIPLADLSDEQYSQLVEEPMLITMLVDLPEANTATA